MGLPAACLSIGEYGSIITLEDRLYEWKSTFVVDCLLLRVSVVDLVVRKCLFFLGSLVAFGELDLG